ncbi:MAG TPA: helix-turn-helix transcriptional regulator [Candidatus Angelobacter sp.]|nr:helix-turn-helix transcriptional regulator [Candidatus Angelobacter sp.]
MALLRKEPKSEPAEKWEAQLRKGCLDLAILACLWEKRLYGLEILRGLEEHSNLVLAEGTVYPILARLKEEGLLH